MRYAVNERHVAHQLVAGEVIAINFVDGAYFSMRATAGEIWQMLSSGVPLVTVVTHYCDQSGGPADTMEGEIRAFASELVTAGLLLPVDERAAAEPGARVDVGALARYESPQLEKFEDMADLIMLDPVHDVSGAGWPHVPERRG